MSKEAIQVGYSADDMPLAFWNKKLGEAIADRRTHFFMESSGLVSLKTGDDFCQLVLKSMPANARSVAVRVSGDYFYAVLFVSDEFVLDISYEPYMHEVKASAWGNDIAGLVKAVKHVVYSLPSRVKVEPDDSLLSFAFWRQTPGGPTASTKDISCPKIEAVRQNYVPRCFKKIGDLAKLTEPDKHGKIILWHGAPGTGKTHAVRALVREWAENAKATVEIALDPEKLLSDANYMYAVLLGEGKPYQVRKMQRISAMGNRVDTTNDPDEDQNGLRIIVIEDAADLFSTGCRDTHGFSRLLNLSDGIVGQGLRCIFLLTANEELGRIDPAVTRPGRCLQVLEFPTFTPEEASAWLEAKGKPCDKLDGKAVTLAELYRIAGDGVEPADASDKAFGF